MKKYFIAFIAMTVLFLSACSSTPQTYKTEYTRKVTVESNEPCVEKHNCTPTLIGGINDQSSSSNSSYDSRQDAEIAHLRERLEDERLARMNDRITDTRAVHSAYNHDTDCGCDREEYGHRGRHYHDDN